MEHIAHDETSFVRPAEVGEMELYHAKTWLGKYVFSQDAKTIAIQYAATAIAIGMVALVLSWSGCALGGLARQRSESSSTWQCVCLVAVTVTSLH